MLVDHILNGKYNQHSKFLMRDILLGASDKILQCNQKPYPFENLKRFYDLQDNNLCFFEKLDKAKQLLFNDKEQEIQPIEQRICSVNQSTNYKKEISIETLLDNARHTPQEKKVFPVENFVVDMQPLNIQTKLLNFRELDGEIRASIFKQLKNWHQLRRGKMISEYMQNVNNKFASSI